MSNEQDDERRGRNRNSWSRYWAMQPDHSLPGSLDADYNGAIADFWRAVAQSLPRGAATLDLATGVGPLPRLLLSCRPDLRIDAIDAADIAPQWRPSPQAKLPRFHALTSCEALPFMDGSFDLITSQFGVEYSNLSLSLTEIARTLRPGGSFAAVLHSQDSRITTVTRDESAHVKLLTAPDGGFEHVEKMITLMALAGTTEGRRKLDADPIARNSRDKFNAQMAQIKKTAETAVVPDILYEFLAWVPQVLKLANQNADASSALDNYRRYRQQLEDAGERYEALLAAALDSNAQTALIKNLQKLGLQTQIISALEQEGHQLGLGIIATRR